ncbi:hypothetical protein RCIP0109_00022 [Klebsiella phage RCIP0109]
MSKDHIIDIIVLVVATASAMVLGATIMYSYLNWGDLWKNLKQHLVDTWPLYVYASAFVIGALRVWLP